MGISQIAPDERRSTHIDAQAWADPLGYPVPREAPAKSRLKRLFGAIGCLLATYLLMDERLFGLAPFIVFMGWMWVTGTVECAQARGDALDW